jgi:hypothetical protein
MKNTPLWGVFCGHLFGLFHCREAAQADLLAGTRLKVAVAALAYQNRGLFGLFYPMAVLLKGFGGAFGLDVFTGSVRDIAFRLGLFWGHKYAGKPHYLS